MFQCSFWPILGGKRITKTIKSLTEEATEKFGWTRKSWMKSSADDSFVCLVDAGLLFPGSLAWIFRLGQSFRVILSGRSSRIGHRNPVNWTRRSGRNRGTGTRQGSVRFTLRNRDSGPFSFPRLSPSRKRTERISKSEGNCAGYDHWVMRL